MWLVTTILDRAILECSSVNTDLSGTPLFSDKAHFPSLNICGLKKAVAPHFWPHISPPTFYHHVQTHTHPMCDTRMYHTYETSLHNIPRLLPGGRAALTARARFLSPPTCLSPPSAGPPLASSAFLGPPWHLCQRGVALQCLPISPL